MFVYLVVILTSSIVGIAYVVLLPLILNTYSPPWIAWHVCYGHWNLIMIAFHYYKAANTSPGYPPTVRYQLQFFFFLYFKLEILYLKNQNKTNFYFVVGKT